MVTFSCQPVGLLTPALKSYFIFLLKGHAWVLNLVCRECMNGFKGSANLLIFFKKAKYTHIAFIRFSKGLVIQKQPKY